MSITKIPREKLVPVLIFPHSSLSYMQMQLNEHKQWQNIAFGLRVSKRQLESVHLYMNIEQGQKNKDQSYSVRSTFHKVIQAWFVVLYVCTSALY